MFFQGLSRRSKVRVAGVVSVLLGACCLHAANAIKVESTTAAPGQQDVLVRILLDNADPIMGLSFAGQYDSRLTFDSLTLEGALFGPDHLDADYVQTISWGTVFGAAVVIELPESLEDPYLQTTLPAGTDQYVLGALFDVQDGLASGTELPIELRDDLRSTANPDSPVVAPVFTVNGETVTPPPQLLSGSITVVAPPSITGVDPTDGPTAGGTPVVISGADFTSDTTVTFGGQPLANAVLVNATTIQGETPAHAAGAVDVTVENPYGSDTLAGGFTYHNPPSITSVSPSSGSENGGTAVTVRGSDFTPDTTVTFNGGALVNPVFVNDTTIQGETPPHAPGAVDVTVENAYGSDTLAGGFTYQEEVPPPPTITSVSPNEGTGDTEVTIQGTNFTPDAVVLFGGTLCSDIVVVSETEIHCHLPACGGIADQWVGITVTTAGGSATLDEGYRCLGIQPRFSRGDANCDGKVDIGDAIMILQHLFQGLQVKCLDAVDANDDGQANIADAIFILAYLFSQSDAPPPPFPDPGVDPTEDALGCAEPCG